MLVSIIIPIRNEEHFVRKCLDSFIRQRSEQQDIELLCVDGMSTDRSREIIRRYTAQDKRVKLIVNPRKITPVAINLGISQSRGDFIMVVSCHAEYASNYIDKCLEVIDRTKADHVGGYMTTAPEKDTQIGRAIATATSSPFGIGNSIFRLKGPEREVDTVPFGMYRREVFEKIDFYDERLVRNQDIELNSRLRKAGGRIIISPEIQITYYNRSTFRGLWQQAFNNGLWNPYTVWLTGGGLSLRHFIPMLFVLGLLALCLGAFLWSPIKWMLLSYIFLYLSSASIYSIKDALRTKASAILILWSYIVLHIAYGIGSLWGIITIPFKFPHRGKNTSSKKPADSKS
jgi:glycosyltransferase involved in cell wall biosynthesis